MIDTHAHASIPPTPFNKGEKLSWIILSASNIQDSKDNLELAKTNAKMLASIGIHPQESQSDVSSQISELEKLMCEEVVAVGECGLEFTDGVDKLKQMELFEYQINLAIKYGKPLIVHSRKASDETIEILSKYPKARGVIHCYTGGKKRIQKVVALGDWYFGIDGNITYEVGLEEVVKSIPKDRLVLETDSPYLAPIPHRGETNKPEWVEFTYKKVAEIWGMSFEETEKIIDKNAKRLFNII